MADQAYEGQVVGIDISDEMIRVARESSQSFPNIVYRVAGAEKLPFSDGHFSHAFSMESLYYYADMPGALKEIKRILQPGGVFVCVVDLYQENRPSHQWVEQLNVPVQLLSTAQYRSLFEQAGFTNVSDRHLQDPAPVPADYTGGSFKTREDFLEYRESGSLMLTGEVSK
jgi:ubiquinone/menaquinone biosynthesis C-methylase UbiE